MLCGTAVCDMGTVCCYKKSPPLALCIPPSMYEAQGCEKMDLPCFTPADCPTGTTCCLNIMDPNNLTVSCKPKPLCLGDGVNTLIACGDATDCTTSSPSCNVLTTLDNGKDFKICAPGAPPP